jgi:hypothetical protein
MIFGATLLRKGRGAQSVMIGHIAASKIASKKQ